MKSGESHDKSQKVKTKQEKPETSQPRKKKKTRKKKAVPIEGLFKNCLQDQGGLIINFQDFDRDSPTTVPLEESPHVLILSAKS